MKWQEVRELFPHQFVLVAILHYHVVEDTKIVDEVAPIRAISDNDANKKFFRAKSGEMVYHTTKKEFIIYIRKDPLLKVRRL